MPSRRRPGAPADLEEVRPDHFVVHNPAAAPILRGEGTREGDRFQLTSWRRDGLIARLRARGFVVLTLADQIAALPALPAAPAAGTPLVRALAPGERISYFAAEPPGWQPAPTVAPGSVQLHEGWIIRRRRGRGPASYSRVSSGSLAPLDEAAALRLGYAGLADQGGAPIVATPATDQGWLLPDLPLPPEHRRLLGRLATRTAAGWHIPAGATPLAGALLARLGLRLRT